MTQNDDPEEAVYTEGVKPPDQTNTAKPPEAPKPSSLEADDADNGVLHDRTIEKSPGPHG